MRKCKIDRLLDAINARRGLTYPSVGYLYYAELTGDGVKRRRKIWRVTNPQGGVALHSPNGRDVRGTIRHLEWLLSTLE